MDRNGMLVSVFLLFFIVADVSNASLLSAFRRFVAVASTGTNQISPSPSPDPLLVGNSTTSNGTTSKDKKVPDDSNKVDSGSKGSIAGPPPQNKKEDVKANGTTNKNDNKTDSQSEVGQNCTGMTRRCKDQDKLVACILNFQTGHTKFVVLVQNEGESNLKVNLSAPNPSDNVVLEILKHQTIKINLTVGNGNEVILKTGKGKCILHVDLPASQENNFLHLPSYDKLITPINGAYFVILTVLIFGGLWLCCLFKKKKQQDGIPYQELEMGLPESSLNNVETAEGWDEGWDDDWDEENAVKSPAAHRTGSISANGLTSRSPKKDQWENDWDD
ncbi:uncharacterized protein LOC110622913 [Manihot esculenta]|uniref:DUF7356 domain-containing protein n=1 Tax=Manihot esculenta TaxID=3983 RepID=A0A251K6F3_MANES|nr:uncharacterized protein LOC110622913 [Manihot esculenta]XP_021623328.1 uncharacterized protein LOC110622913 [Manihot esculenta]OAY41639.1 hypothetical protein MANES_09G118000v8 [Manihot esculenta]OAY41640.1 hypothetical protein MANES_09G118000v8 [Manihot esculenta]